MTFAIEFAPEAIDHVKGLSAFDRATVVEQIEVQLANQPEAETRNRKMMRENPLAKWELRVGALRVFYNVISEEPKVRVVAVGRKEGNRFFIGGEEVQL